MLLSHSCSPHWQAIFSSSPGRRLVFSIIRRFAMCRMANNCAKWCVLLFIPILLLMVSSVHAQWTPVTPPTVSKIGTLQGFTSHLPMKAGLLEGTMHITEVFYSTTSAGHGPQSLPRLSAVLGTLQGFTSHLPMKAGRLDLALLNLIVQVFYSTTPPGHGPQSLPRL